MIIAGHYIGREIAEALGLHETTDIKIHVPLEGVATVIVTYYPDVEHLQNLTQVLAEYELIPRRAHAKEQGKS